MMPDVPEKDFQLLWNSHGREIVSLCGLLEDGMRGAHTEEFVGLSPREKECLTWLATGLAPKQISHRLAISDRTLEKHIGSAKKKLRANTRDHAVARALMLGVIHP